MVSLQLQWRQVNLKWARKWRRLTNGQNIFLKSNVSSPPISRNSTIALPALLLGAASDCEALPETSLLPDRTNPDQ